MNGSSSTSLLLSALSGVALTLGVSYVIKKCENNPLLVDKDDEEGAFIAPLALDKNSNDIPQELLDECIYKLFSKMVYNVYIYTHTQRSVLFLYFIS